MPKPSHQSSLLDPTLGSSHSIQSSEQNDGVVGGGGEVGGREGAARNDGLSPEGGVDRKDRTSTKTLPQQFGYNNDDNHCFGARRRGGGR